MLLRHAKNLIETVPEAMDFIKEAGVFDHVENMHLPANAMATALSIAYMEKTAQEIDPELLIKTNQALALHGLEKKAGELIGLMQARMQAPKVDLEKEAQARVNAVMDLASGTNRDLEKAAELSTWLKSSPYSDTHAVRGSEVVDLYSCDGFMDKQAAEAALLYRARLSGKDEFVKAAQVVKGFNVEAFTPAQSREVCNSVLAMEKAAGLERFGLNFYKEVMIVGDLQKKAYAMGLSVRLAGKDIPVEKILGADYGKLEATLGTEVATNLHGDPMTVKAVVESLPMDSQKILEAIL